MELIVSPRGEITTIYSEVINLAALGLQRVQRASQVEPDAEGRWWAQVIDGPHLGPFERRSEAIAAEIDWLTRNRLLRPGVQTLP
jgi:hypothetical protein